MIDDPQIQQAFEQLWEESNFGSIENPNPERERVEKGGYIVSNEQGGYNFQPIMSRFINEKQSGPCKISFSAPDDLPDGTIFCPYASL